MIDHHTYIYIIATALSHIQWTNVGLAAGLPQFYIYIQYTQVGPQTLYTTSASIFTLVLCASLNIHVTLAQGHCHTSELLQCLAVQLYLFMVSVYISFVLIAYQQPEINHSIKQFSKVPGDICKLDSDYTGIQNLLFHILCMTVLEVKIPRALRIVLVLILIVLLSRNGRFGRGCTGGGGFLWILLFRVCRTQSRLTAVNGMMVHLAGTSQSVSKKEEAFRCTETATVHVCSMSLHQTMFSVYTLR